LTKNDSISLLEEWT